jgi:hypothetical protein
VEFQTWLKSTRVDCGRVPPVEQRKNDQSAREEGAIMHRRSQMRSTERPHDVVEVVFLHIGFGTIEEAGVDTFDDHIGVRPSGEGAERSC